MDDMNVESSLPASPAIRTEEERELAATTDPRKRRLIQNRIAQRVYRQKQKKKLHHLEQQALSLKTPTSPLQSPPTNYPTNLTDAQAIEYASWTPLAMTYPFANTITQRVTSPKPQGRASPSASSGPPSQRALGFHADTYKNAPADLQFITITRTPLHTAILTNLSILGLTADAYVADSTTSPFYEEVAADILPPPPSPPPHSLLHRAPDLAPTLLQQTVCHHPYIDILPFPGLRDNLLLALEMEALDEEEFCTDVQRYLCAWGDMPWDARSYEWAPEFVEKWGWVLDWKEVRGSNWWRLLRGESPLEEGGE